MQAYLNKGIKEIIDQYPAVAKVLDEYGIGCGPCNVGTCLLTPEQEQELMQRIANTVYPGQDVEIPVRKEQAPVEKTEIKYSPPMKKLVDEHVLIKRWIALIPKVVENLDVETQEGRQLILEGVDMIRSYADRYHHAKEEDILFKYFDENSEILKVMYADHTTGRGHVKAILEALERRDKAVVAEHLTAYRDLLTEHIRKEDEILYPWMDRNLSTKQIGELFAKFNQADEQMGFSPAKYERFVVKLEKKYNH